MLFSIHPELGCERSHALDPLYLVVSHFLFARTKQLLFIIMVMVGVVNTFTLEIYAFVKLNY